MTHSSRTTASIVPPFLPRFALPLASDSGVDATVSQGKTVDFALVLMPPSDSPLQQAMWHLLRDLPMDKKCLSQTDYGPLYFFPAPVAIATKAPNGDKEEAKIQLGIWTAAWMKSMRELLRHANRVSDERMIAACRCRGGGGSDLYICTVQFPQNGSGNCEYLPFRHARCCVSYVCPGAALPHPFFVPSKR